MLHILSLILLISLSSTSNANPDGRNAHTFEQEVKAHGGIASFQKKNFDGSIGYHVTLKDATSFVIIRSPDGSVSCTKTFYDEYRIKGEPSPLKRRRTIFLQPSDAFMIFTIFEKLAKNPNPTEESLVIRGCSRL